MATARSRRRKPLKGRSLVALGLLTTMVVASLVVWRRSVGVASAKEMAASLREKRSLDAERLNLGRELRDAQTRRRVVGEAERRLGMHVASDSQTRVVTAPGREP